MAASGAEPAMVPPVASTAMRGSAEAPAAFWEEEEVVMAAILSDPTAAAIWPVSPANQHASDHFAQLARDLLLGQLRREHLDQPVRVLTQERALAQTHARRARLEQVLGVERDQFAIALRIVGHRRDHAHAHAEFDVGLDHVRVDGGQHHVGHHARFRERLVDVRAAREILVIGDDRIFGDVFEREILAAHERMRLRHDHHVMPRIARERHDIGETIERFGRDADIGLAVDDHLRDLLRIALAQRQMHLREHLAELVHDLRQRIARLRVSRRHDEVAAVLIGELARHAAQVLRVEQHALDQLMHGLARLRETREALAASNEDVDAQLVLQILDLLRHTRLRRVQHVRHFGQVHVLPHGLAHETQLLKIHVLLSGTADRLLMFLV
ncbi:hypothetical protein PT2222_250087 [Paraburkholderia tropica]